MNAVRWVCWVAKAVCVGAACVGLLSACSSEPEPRSLVGTSWRLATIESMNDAEGLTPVPDASEFTVSFGDDGNAAFKLDCNTGNGTFEATPTGDGATGTLTFGPIATTLMGCPGQSLDQKVSAALPHVRGYIFKNEQLHMSLMLDGGILSWNPL